MEPVLLNYKNNRLYIILHYMMTSFTAKCVYKFEITNCHKMN